MKGNMGHIDISALSNCYAKWWSYGEICVGCNCCGRIDKSKRTAARLHFWKEFLKDMNEFNGWFHENPEIVAIQKKNNAKNKALAKRRIRYYERQIAK